MGMGNSFETITVLQYRLKEAQEELAAFQSGEKYIRMEKQHLTQVRALERRIAKLEAAVAKEHSHAITIRNQWFEIFEHRQKECDRMVAETLKKAAVMEKRALRAEKQRDATTAPLSRRSSTCGKAQPRHPSFVNSVWKSM